MWRRRSQPNATYFCRSADSAEIGERAVEPSVAAGHCPNSDASSLSCPCLRKMRQCFPLVTNLGPRQSTRAADCVTWNGRMIQARGGLCGKKALVLGYPNSFQHHDCGGRVRRLGAGGEPVLPRCELCNPPLSLHYPKRGVLTAAGLLGGLVRAAPAARERRGVATFTGALPGLAGSLPRSGGPVRFRPDRHRVERLRGAHVRLYAR